MQPTPALHPDADSSAQPLPRWVERLNLTHPSSAADRLSPPASSDDELSVLQQALDRYDVLDCIDRGGQGAVYRAWQKGASRFVALKVLLDGPLANDRQRFRFEREIELISRLQHPNIVTLYDSGVVRGRLFYTMEYVDGLAIDDYAIFQDLSPRGIVQLLVSACRAVHFAHQSGVIHRDLKPAHIVVGDDGRPRVFDFGLAKDVSDDSGDPRYSCTGQFVGTLPYLSPEQAGGGDGQTDVRSDVYALGVILYRLLTERFPYTIDGPPEQVRRAIISTEPLPLRRALDLAAAERAPRPHEINRDLEAVLNKALAKSKDERYQSAADLADDLERWLSGAAVTARSASPWYRVRKTIRRHRVGFGIAAAIGLTLIGSTVAVSLAWANARGERDRAHTSLRGFSGVFKTAIDELEGSIRRLPGGYAVRNRLIEGIGNELPNLEALLESDPALAELEATYLEKRADIDMGQGRRADAAEGYKRLQDRAQRLVKSLGATPERRLLVLIAQRKLAENTDDAEALYTRAVAYGEESAAAYPDNDDIRRELCKALVEHGSFIKRAGDEYRAADVLEQAFVLLSHGSEHGRESDDWMRLRARAHGERGSTRLMVGQGEEGLADLHQSLQLREIIVEKNPPDTEARHDLMSAYYIAGLAERDRGNPDEALRLYELGARVGRELVKLDPTATRWQRTRFQIHHDLALLRLARKELDLAREHLAVAIELADAVTTATDGSSDRREDSAAIAIVEGRVELACEEPEAALRCFERACELRQALATEHPESGTYRQHVATALYALGLANRKLGRLDAAQRYYAQSFDIYARLAELNKTVDDQVNAIQAQINLAAFLITVNESSADYRAFVLLESAADEFQRLQDDGRLLGNERITGTIENALETNRRILSRRGMP